MKTIYQKNYNKVYSEYSNNSGEFRNLTLDEKFLDDSVLMKDFFSTLSYWSSPYSNPMNSGFIGKVNNLNAFKNIETFFCRDGLFFLIHFFLKFPAPGSLRTVLIVNLIYAEIVPRAWMKNVVFYERGTFSIIKNYNWENRDSLIIKCVLFDQEFETKNQNDLLKIEKLKRIDFSKYKKVKIFMWQRNDGFLNYSWGGDKFFAKRLNKFYHEMLVYLSKFKNVEFIDYDQLSSLKNYHTYCFYDLNAKWAYVGDDYLDYLLLSRGVIPLDKGQRRSIFIEQFIPLSPHHGFRLLNFESVGTIGTNFEFYKKVKKKEDSQHLTSLNRTISQFNFQLHSLEDKILINEFNEF